MSYQLTKQRFIIQTAHGIFSAFGLNMSLSSIENRDTWIIISNLFALLVGENFKYQA
jgi:hypothetical protein